MIFLDFCRGDSILFTGIIEDLGTVAAIKRSPTGAVLTIRTAMPVARITLGESIAINGACMTVTGKGRGAFAMDISAESLRRTTLGELKPRRPRQSRTMPHARQAHRRPPGLRPC
jgi:riboflavin synthase